MGFFSFSGDGCCFCSFFVGFVALFFTQSYLFPCFDYVFNSWFKAQGFSEVWV